MPEDIIARALSEQASRSERDLRTVIPGLVIGLGFWGFETLLELQRLLDTERFPELEPSAVLLHIGSTRQTGAHRLTCERLQIAPDWTPEGLRHRHIEEWLSPELTRTQPEVDDVRQVARLAFFQRYSALRSSLCAARDRTLAYGRETRTGSASESSVGSRTTPLAVYVVASLADGFGGGVLFDLLQLIQVVVAGWQSKIVTYLGLPPGDFHEEGRLGRANAYAALKELDYLNAGGELPVRYSPLDPASGIRAPKVDACYLMTIGNGPLPPGDDRFASSVVAAHVLANFVKGGLAISYRESQDRLSRYTKPGREDEAGCQTTYRALGYAGFHIRPQRRLKAWEATVTSRILAAVTGEPGENIGPAAARFSAPWAPGDLGGGLLRRLGAANGRPLRDEIRALVVNSAKRLRTEVRDGRGVVRWLGECVADLSTALAATSVGSDKPQLDDQERKMCPLPERVGENLSRTLRTFETALEAEIRSLSTLTFKPGDAGSWIEAPLQFLRSVGDRFGTHVGQAAVGRQKDLEALARWENLLATSLEEVAKAYSHPFARFAPTRTLLTEGALAGLWRSLEEALGARLRVLLWDHVPRFHVLALGAVRRRIIALETMRNTVGEVQSRAKSALTDLTDKEGECGELFDIAWIAKDVADREAEFGSEVARDPAGPVLTWSEWLARQLLERCGAVSPTDLLIAQLAGTDAGLRLGTAAVDISCEVVRSLPQRTAADRFFERYPQEETQRAALVSLVENAEPLLTLTEKESGGQWPTTMVIGVPGGPANPRGKFSALLDIFLAAIEDTNTAAVATIVGLPATKDYVMVFREVAGFPLRHVATIPELAASYRDYVKYPRSEPVHIVKDPGAFDTVPGIFPPDDHIRRQALEAVALGVPLGVIDIENDVLLHRQRLPGMTFLDTRILGTLDRPLRAVKYLIEQPELLKLIRAQVASQAESMRAEPALREDRLRKLERYFARLLAHCQRLTGIEDFGVQPQTAQRGMPHWDLAQAILEFNTRNGFDPPPFQAGQRNTPSARHQSQSALL